MKISATSIILFLTVFLATHLAIINAYPEKSSPLDYGLYGLFALGMVFAIRRLLKEEAERQRKLEEELRRLNEELREKLFEYLNTPNTPDMRIWTKEELLFGLEKMGEITADAIKTRYRELARLNHPDLGGTEGKMKEVNSAYSLLLEKYRFA